MAFDAPFGTIEEWQACPLWKRQVENLPVFKVSPLPAHIARNRKKAGPWRPSLWFQKHNVLLISWDRHYRLASILVTLAGACSDHALSIRGIAWDST